MSRDSKYGLRNASDLLNRLRRKYTKGEAEESQYQHNKTFIEEESLELYENGITSMRKESISTHRKPQDTAMQNLSEIKVPQKEETTFCDRLIIKNLQETLQIYEKDLEILIENRTFLQEKIEFMSQKVRKLKEIEHNNKLLTAENEKSKEYLQLLIKEYHESMELLFKSQIAQQEAYNSLRSKIRLVIKETGEDYQYIGFIESWNHHVEKCSEAKALIIKEINESRKREEEQKNKEKITKVQKIAAIPEKGRVNKYEEEQYVAPDQAKPKKKLSEAERASLLGDLKSFAKNFKFPSG